MLRTYFHAFHATNTGIRIADFCMMMPKELHLPQYLFWTSIHTLPATYTVIDYYLYIGSIHYFSHTIIVLLLAAKVRLFHKTACKIIMEHLGLFKGNR